jgi:hypothetical protein
VADDPVLLHAQLIDAARRLLEEHGLIVRAPSLLDMTYRDLQSLGAQGVALYWLADRLGGVWASRPDEPLVNVIRSGSASDPRLLAELARELRKVGIRDLDEHLPPDDPAWDRP